MERHCATAMKIAQILENHPKVNWLKYPFLKSHRNYELAKKQMRLGGNIIAFEVEGGIEAGRNFLNAIKMCSLTANLGDSRTIVSHPASTTHAKLSEEEKLAVGITNGMIRLSIGLEHHEDILEDILQAFETI